MEQNKLRVIVDGEDTSEETQFSAARTPIEDVLRSALSKRMAKSLDIPVESLAKNVSTAFASVLDVLKDVPNTTPQYVMSEISFTLAVDAEGKISLFSAVSGSLGTQMGLTFKLTAMENTDDENITT